MRLVPIWTREAGRRQGDRGKNGLHVGQRGLGWEQFKEGLEVGAADSNETTYADCFEVAALGQLLDRAQGAAEFTGDVLETKHRGLRACLEV